MKKKKKRINEEHVLKVGKKKHTFTSGQSTKHDLNVGVFFVINPQALSLPNTDN